ncbi:MAG: DnaJ domain-containing protein [Proteobacteria bacterium]|nr:DnaJ domain-containing protein [Pseudomonadota bacterium]
MQYIDYYQVLGVERSASVAEIRKAYKRLARKFHPDLNKAADAEANFKRVNEAYEVLKDAQKRQRYDTLGPNWKDGSPFEPPSGWRGTPGGGGVRVDFGEGGGDFSDFFEVLFGGARGGARRGARGMGFEDLFSGAARRGGAPGAASDWPAPPANHDVEAELTIELEDVMEGRKRAFEISGPGGRRRYDVTIPKGIRDGERLRLAGQGAPASSGRSGHLLLTIRVAPHRLFRIEGDDLVVELPVAAWDAALGASLPVPTVDGQVQLKLPAGVTSGQRLRLRGKGLPRHRGGHGDLLAAVRITVPSQLSDAQRELFERLKQTS